MTPDRPAPDGSSSTSTPTTTSASAGSGYRPPELAFVYPTHNPEKPVAVAVQRDGALSIVQVSVRHAAGLVATLAHLVAQHVERNR